MNGKRLFEHRYKILRDYTKPIIAIVDGKSGKTVTNSIEDILRVIGKAEEIDIKKYLVIYKDTNDIWDGWDTVNEDFIPLNQKTMIDAIREIIGFVTHN